MQDSPAVKVALAHIDAWSRHDWEKTRELLAPDIHALVTTTQAEFSEFKGVDNYMARKMKGAQLVEPGSVQVLSAIGDESSALILMSMRIGLGPGGAMVTMARAGLYLLDESKKIKEERDEFFVVSQ
jgi:SnoaL-like domain